MKNEENFFFLYLSKFYWFIREIISSFCYDIVQKSFCVLALIILTLILSRLCHVYFLIDIWLQKSFYRESECVAKVLVDVMKERLVGGYMKKNYSMKTTLEHSRNSKCVTANTRYVSQSSLSSNIFSDLNLLRYTDASLSFRLVS